MVTIRRVTYLACPFTAAIELAKQNLEQSLEGANIKAITLRDSSDDARQHPALAVDIAPLDAAAHPRFAMVLAARPWHHGCRLVLYATYEAPSGVLPWVHHAVVGRHRAAKIATIFLRNTRLAVERAWALQL
jgi:hypothetical protein